MIIDKRDSGINMIKKNNAHTSCVHKIVIT